VRKKKESLPPKKITFEKLRRMRELRQKGLTYKEIGKRLGVSTATVSLHLGERRKRGILEGLRRRLGRR
jgi:predicted transcriptional regulator